MPLKFYKFSFFRNETFKFAATDGADFRLRYREAPEWSSAKRGESRVRRKNQKEP
jgi:hypothetical protein